MTDFEFGDKYPFIRLSPDSEDTWLDMIPKPWARTFGRAMIEDIAAIIEEKGIKDFTIIDMKEKWGMLRVCFAPFDVDILEVVGKYEAFSDVICPICGKPKGAGFWACFKCDRKMRGEK